MDQMVNRTEEAARRGYSPTEGSMVLPDEEKWVSLTRVADIMSSDVLPSLKMLSFAHVAEFQCAATRSGVSTNP